MHARSIQRIFSALDPHKSGALLKCLRSEFRHFQQFFPARKATVLLAVCDNIFAIALLIPEI